LNLLNDTDIIHGRKWPFPSWAIAAFWSKTIHGFSFLIYCLFTEKYFFLGHQMSYRVIYNPTKFTVSGLYVFTRKE